MNESEVEMPPPEERNLRLASRKSSLAKSLPQQAAFASQNLEDLAIYDAAGDQCCECSKSMTLAGHYVAYLCCTKCRYSSCCAKAMSVHVSLFHSSPTPSYTLGAPLILDSHMHCVCGFQATSGNKLAKHLATHGCRWHTGLILINIFITVTIIMTMTFATRSAYSTKEDAQEARVAVEGQEVEEDEEEMEMEEEEQEVEKDEQQKQEEEEAFKKQCKTSPKKKILLKKASPKKASDDEDEEKENAEAQENEENEEGEEKEEATPKAGGMFLFGTLFNTMGDTKEGEEKVEKRDDMEKKGEDGDVKGGEKGEKESKETEKGDDPEEKTAEEDMETS